MIKKLLLIVGAGLVISATSIASQTPPATIKVLQASKDFDQTVSHLITTIESKNMTIFAVIDHQSAAKEAGLEMQPAKVIIFGAPKAGTPLMVKDPLFALSLPLKVLVTELPTGEIVVAHQTTAALIADSQIEAADVANSLAKAEALIANIVGQ